MADEKRMSRDATRQNQAEPDRGDLTPPHGDELPASARETSQAGGDGLIREETFGRTDRYANRDDPEAESPVFDHPPLVPEKEMHADAERRRFELMDDAAADDARMATRKREHSAD